MLTMLCVVFTLFFFESHILSSNLSAKVSGRVEAGFICMKCILVLLSEILAYHIGQGATSVLIFLCGFSWILSVWYCMPFVHHSMNRGQLAAACSFSFASICLMIGLVYPMYDAGITLYLGIPLSAIGGIWLADIRRSSLMRKSPLQMTSAFEAELKVRYIVQGAIFETLHPKSVQPRIQAEWQDPLSASALDVSVPLPVESRRSTVTSLPGNVLPVQTVVNDEWIATYRQVDAEARAAMLRNALPRPLIELLEQQFRDSVVRMPRSSLLHIFIARFYSTFVDNRHMEVSHLIQAQRLFPWLDVAFLAFQGKRHAEASGGQHATSALNRVAFERHLTEARRHTAAAVAAQAAFWAELLNSKPSVDVLNKIASTVARASRAAELAFQGLFAVNPQSVIALRLHAQYNQMVCNNQEKAGTIAAEADRLEDHAAKQEHGALYGISQSFGLQFFRQTSIDVQSDSTGVANIGGTSRDLGLIFECNAALCRMFGYSRIQLERRNVSILLPAPFADMHDGFLRKFISTGEGRIVANTILVFGKHR
jgi:PAS domain-containing protein